MEGEIVYEITTSPYPLAESPICRSTFLQTSCLQSCWSTSHARKKMVTKVLIVLVRVRDSKVKSVRKA